MVPRHLHYPTFCTAIPPFARLFYSIAKNLNTDEDFENLLAFKPIKESVTNKEASSTIKELEPVLLTRNQTTKI
jgi:hypothetical protein